MSLRGAISFLVAGIGAVSLLPAVIAVESALAGQRAENQLRHTSLDKRFVLAKAKKAKLRAAVQPDQYLREEFSDGAIRVEPAAETMADRAPLHGYGSFEGVVLVAPAAPGAGVVLVEPAAAPAPVMETAEEEQIPEDLSEEQEDPFESLNRLFFSVNEVLDHLVLEPSARVYHVVVPEPLRQGISNALRNVTSPVVLANDILQGNRQGASDTLVRLMVNSTIGIGGLVDAAGYMGVQYHSEDFGQTLAVWGAGPGPYMVVPVLGPSNPRDLAGKAVDTAFNPLTWVLWDAPLEERLAPSGVELLVGRESILDDYDNLRKTSPDLYASVRSIYGEKRQTEISNGDVTGEPIPSVTSLPPSSMMTVTPFKPF